MGGIAMKDMGFSMQVLGCIIGSVAIFLPSGLLVLFFFPIWSNMKKYATVYRALEGINAVVVGIMIASCLYMMKDFTPGSILMLWLNIGCRHFNFYSSAIQQVTFSGYCDDLFIAGWIF